MKKFETAKILLFMIITTYFVGVGVGTLSILKILMDYPDYAIQGLQAYFVFIGGATTAVIGFYVWKAKAENVIKIPKLMDEEAIERKEKIERMINRIGEDF